MFSVLSIDVDYVFSPGIESYDDYVTGSRVPLLEELKYLQRLGYEPRISNEKILQLSKAMAKVSRDVPCHVITHHHEILKYLPNQPFQIFNFDHHHDIFYDGWHDKNVLDEGNWVYNLNENENFKKYTWIRNEESEEAPKTGLNFVFEEVIMGENDVVMPEFSLITLCSSPHWTFDLGNIIIERLLTDWNDAEKI
tara:strand:- start:188 stop:772 length:585 start_codon:yes stop_codon:yes gene_type:complete